MKRSTVIAGLGIVAAGTFAVSPTAHAEERVCRGTIGAQTVDNLRVPSNPRRSAQPSSTAICSARRTPRR